MEWLVFFIDNLKPILFGGFVVLCAYIYHKVLTVPANTSVVIARFGVFNRVLSPGIHFVWHPFDELCYTTWSYRDQENKNCKVDTCFVNTDLMQMDTPPISCVSHETTPIEVDATVMYKVTDVRRAMYEVSDTLNYFYQSVLQATRDVCATMTLPELQGHDITMSERIADYTNRLMGEGDDFKGIKCVKVVIQKVSLSPEVLNERKKRYEAEETHRRKMDLLKHDEDVQKREHALLLEKSKMESERQYNAVKPYLDLNFTPDQYVALKMSEALYNAKGVHVYIGNPPAMTWATKKYK